MTSSSGTSSAAEREMSEEYGNLVPYTPPEWSKGLKVLPRHRYVLCMRPTPIHRWHLPGVPADFSVNIKRDDLTGSMLSGNKVRGMEFHLAEARARGCDCVVTVGSSQSNHCRTTAISARHVGLEAHLLLVTKSAGSVGCAGNMLLDRMSGAHIVTLTPDLTEGRSLQSLIEEYAARLRSKGRNPYTIPVGGHSVVGLWGYLEVYQELMGQGLWDRFSDVVACSGSGGTSSALAIANYLTGSKIKVHAVAVPVPGCVPLLDLETDMRSLGIEGVAAGDVLDVIEGYLGEGYGIASRELKEMIVRVFATTAISLDTTYTAKSVQGLVGELQRNPGRFQGKNILFVHTGGVFSLLDGSMDEVVQSTSVSSQIHSFTEHNE